MFQDFNINYHSLLLMAGVINQTTITTTEKKKTTIHKELDLFYHHEIE